MIFHIGDKVRATINCGGAKKGQIYTIIECSMAGEEHPEECLKLEGTGCCCGKGWELVLAKAEIAEAEK